MPTGGGQKANGGGQKARPKQSLIGAKIGLLMQIMSFRQDRSD